MIMFAVARLFVWPDRVKIVSGGKSDTGAANFFTYAAAVCVWRISTGDVRLFNLFTVR